VYRIGKKFTFDASHQLNGLRPNHKCGRLHGHTYTIEVTFIGGTLAVQGWLFDFGDLDGLGNWVKNEFDHRHLNDKVNQPTSECLARVLYHRILEFMETQHIVLPEDVLLEKVRVSETPSTFAEYFGAD